MTVLDKNFGIFLPKKIRRGKFLKYGKSSIAWNVTIKEKQATTLLPEISKTFPYNFLVEQLCLNVFN